ncbi:MAG TPA: hypothetical protein VMS79_02605 [Methanomassiliicoccales archaeon]|jgi:hypothetical protein|nr:hypothetical protein [Methanomassiliicoccales archaeon]
MNNVLQISIVAFFLLVVRFGLSFLDVQFYVGDTLVSVSLVAFVVAVIVGSMYSAFRRWDLRVTTTLAVGGGAILIAFVPPAWALYVLVLNILMIGWCMHVTGRFW